MKIQDLIVETKKVKWQDLKDLQPENFKTKEHREKLKTSIKGGIISVLIVWTDPKDGITKTADGHQRISILHELIKEGYEVPEQISCAFLDNEIINTEKEAVKCLLKFNQKTEQITKDGLEVWLEEMDLSVDDVCFDDLDIKFEVDNVTLGDTVTGDERREIQGHDADNFEGGHGFFKVTLLFNREQYVAFTNFVKNNNIEHSSIEELIVNFLINNDK